MGLVFDVDGPAGSKNRTISGTRSSSGSGPIIPRQQRPQTERLRAGCSTCKKRHVKCDERKPSCLKCEKANLECEGYEVFRIWVGEQLKQTKSTGPSREPSLSPGAEETRSMQFFHEKTKPSLALFNSAAFSFWTIVIPRLATLEDTIKYHLVATASAHELSMSRKNDPRVAKLLMSAYSKAIRLVAYDKAPRTEIILTSCLLSVAMESVQGHYATAYKHLCSGLAILEDWRATDHTKEDDPHGLVNQYLEPIFSQLAATFGLLFSNSTDPLILSNISWTPPSIPNQFASIHEARESLAALAAYVNILSRKNLPFEDHGTPVVESLKAAWLTWTTTFHALRPTLTTARSLKQWTLLSVFATVHKIAFHCYCSPTEESWDTFLPALRTQVDMCAELDAQIDTYTTEDAVLMDPGIIVPLWQIAIGCRDPALRRRAVQLMHAHHRKCSGGPKPHSNSNDRNNNSPSDCFIALHAQATIDLEESPLPTQHPPHGPTHANPVPESHRIRPLTASVTTPGFLSMSFTRGATDYKVVEHHSVPFPTGVSVPEGRSVQMWPMSKVVRLAGYQLLIRPEARGCRCGGFGGGGEGEEGGGMVAL